jgi:RNA polymerase sigma-70 factor (ECF subfamily)
MAFGKDDAALVQGLREGQPGATAAFFARYSRYVERIITHLIGFDRELADLLQEVFLQALAGIHSLNDPLALRAWLSRIATTTVQKTLRTRSRRAWLRLFTDQSEETQWEAAAANADEDTLRALRTVYEVLERLPTDERIVFSLRFIEGMDFAELTIACGVSTSTVKRRLRRAEHRFLAFAKRRPELAVWLKEGTRWTDR